MESISKTNKRGVVYMKKGILSIICFLIVVISVIGRYDYSYADTIDSYSEVVTGRVDGNSTGQPI